MSISASAPATRATCMSPACSAAQSSSAVLPTPASPRSTSTPLSPSRTAASTPSSAPVSTARSSNALIALPSSAPSRAAQVAGGRADPSGTGPDGHRILQGWSDADWLVVRPVAPLSRSPAGFASVEIPSRPGETLAQPRPPFPSSGRAASAGETVRHRQKLATPLTGLLACRLAGDDKSPHRRALPCPGS